MGRTCVVFEAQLFHAERQPSELNKYDVFCFMAVAVVAIDHSAVSVHRVGYGYSAILVGQPLLLVAGLNPWAVPYAADIPCDEFESVKHALTP